MFFYSRSKVELRSHKVKNHQGEYGALAKICDLCGIGTKDMKTHLLEKHGNLNFPCNKCGKTFKSQSTLNSHVTRMHKMVKCSHCDVVMK